MVAPSDRPTGGSLFSQGLCGGFLPLPSTPVGCTASSHLSRGMRQRVARRNFVEKEIQSLTDAVNWLGGCQTAPVSRDAASTHEHFIARARVCVEERCEEERFFEESTQEAVPALLRSRSGYADEPDAGVGGLATFKQGNVSLPTSSVGSPLLRSLVSDKAGSMCVKVAQCETMRVIVCQCAPLCVYMRLCIQNKTYVSTAFPGWPTQHKDRNLVIAGSRSTADIDLFLCRSNDGL